LANAEEVLHGRGCASVFDYWAWAGRCLRHVRSEHQEGGVIHDGDTILSCSKRY